MKFPTLLIALVLTAISALWSDAAKTMITAKEGLQVEFCSKQNTVQSPCEVTYDAVVVNRLAAEEYLWAFSYEIKSVNVRNQKETLAAQIGRAHV